MAEIGTWDESRPARDASREMPVRHGRSQTHGTEEKQPSHTAKYRLTETN